jgi:hypothetical protein
MVQNCKIAKFFSINDHSTVESFLKIYQDSSLILDDNPKSLEQSLFMLNKFSECAGLRVNLDKTEAIWLGSKRSCDEQLLPDTDLPTDPPPIMTRGGSSFSPAKLPTKN